MPGLGKYQAATAAFPRSITMNGVKPEAMAAGYEFKKTENHETPPAKMISRPVIMLASDER